jgi:hypothetical protein
LDKQMKDIRDTQRDLLERIQTEGVQAAYEAALSVCKDAKAPAPARATAAATLFRVAGYFEKKSDGLLDKDPHEMTAGELNEAIRRLGKQANKGGRGDIFD